MYMQAMATGEAALVAEAPVVPSLSPLEWRVVMLARREADRFGRAAVAPMRLRSVLARLFGGQGLARLADDRLEALRQFVCLARRHDRRLAAAAATLLALGFAPATVEMLKTVAVG